MLGFSPLASQPLNTSGNFVPTTAGVLAITEDSDTLASTGALLIQATATITEADDTVSSVVGNFVIGSADITEADDTCVAILLRNRFLNITTSRPITAGLITTTYN